MCLLLNKGDPRRSYGCFKSNWTAGVRNGLPVSEIKRHQKCRFIDFLETPIASKVLLQSEHYSSQFKQATNHRTILSSSLFLLVRAFPIIDKQSLLCRWLGIVRQFTIYFFYIFFATRYHFTVSFSPQQDKSCDGRISWQVKGRCDYSQSL